MSISDKTKKSLEKIGLTSYEIRAYTTLIKDGESNASEISQNSGVPYSKIYEILGTLEEKGWIGSDDSAVRLAYVQDQSQLPGRREGLLVDCGAIDNLAGIGWVRRHAAAADQTKKGSLVFTRS